MPVRDNQVFIIFRHNPDTHIREYRRKRKWFADPLRAKCYANAVAASEAMTKQNPQTEGIATLDASVFAHLTNWHTT